MCVRSFDLLFNCNYVWFIYNTTHIFKAVFQNKIIVTLPINKTCTCISLHTVFIPENGRIPTTKNPMIYFIIFFIHFRLRATARHLPCSLFYFKNFSYTLLGDRDFGEYLSGRSAHMFYTQNTIILKPP